MRHRCDEAEPATCFSNFDIAGGAAALIGDVIERPPIHQAGPDNGKRQILIGTSSRRAA